MPINRYGYDPDEIVRRFKAGISTTQIAKELNISGGPRQVSRVLRRSGIQQKKATPKREFTEDQIQEMIARYQAGDGMANIARSYECSETVTRRVLEKALDESQLRKRETAFTEEEGLKLRKEYEEGKGKITYKMLSEKYGGSTASVRTAILRAGGKGRGRGKLRILSEDQEKEIAERYTKEGGPAIKIAKDLGVSESTILEALKRQGIELSHGPERILSDEQIQEAKVLYDQGENMSQIAERYGLSRGAIRLSLMHAETEIRERGVPLDSLQDAIDGTGRFASDEEYSLYVYTIIGHDEQLKIGISSLRHNRAATSQGFYKEKIFEVIYPSRREAFYLEQAILKETAKFYNPPLEIVEHRDSRGARWGGVSELRKMKYEQLRPCLDFYISEMEDIGEHEFAIRYLPLTSMQAKRCKQMASAEESS